VNSERAKIMVLPVEGEASSLATLTRLQNSALAIANDSGDARARDPKQAVTEWKGPIAARWSLLAVSELDGVTYLVARQNRPRVRCSTALTDREQEVVAFAAMGHHNKLIAYDLGISHSTVRVLMSRAAGKMRTRSREELIRRWTEKDHLSSQRQNASPAAVAATGVGKIERRVR
jgi:DNA-binding CsgD family transcriptional regulator